MTAWKIERALIHLGYKDAKMSISVTKQGMPFITESGNPIIDLRIGKITNAEQLDGILNNTPGVIETGLFIGICGVVIMGTDNGVVELTRA